MQKHSHYNSVIKQTTDTGAAFMGLTSSGTSKHEAKLKWLASATLPLT